MVEGTRLEISAAAKAGDADSARNILTRDSIPALDTVLAGLHEANVLLVNEQEAATASAEQARKNAGLTGTDINFLQVGRMLPFEDESFDLIISRDVTWTLTEPEVQLRHWANKLKKGGTML